MSKRYTITLLCLMACTAARGCQEWGAGAHLGTYHFDRSEQRREFNPGLYLRCDRISAGLFVNSASKPSWWAGYTWRHGPFGLTAGAITGYRNAGGQAVLPLLVVTVDLPGGFRLGAFPNSGSRSGGLHLMRDF